MRVLITGTSSGIGKATAELFIERGHEVIGIDIKLPAIVSTAYTHYMCDVTKPHLLPSLAVDIVINNAGTIEEDTAMSTNLEGYVNIVEKYCYNHTVKSLINVASISGHVGLDTARYAASQGARLAYTKHLAITLGQKYGMKVNSVSPGAVLTGLEPHLYKHGNLVDAVANENLLKKWIMPEEMAEWLYFVAVHNKSMTGQDILIDNGEVANYNFICAREDNQ